MPRAATARFTATVVRSDEGLRHHLLPVPGAIAARFPGKRVLLTVGAHTFRRAIQRHADGEAFILLGRDTLDTAGLVKGQTIAVLLASDPEPDAVDLPVELGVVLDQDPAARARWERLTPGLRRTLAHPIATAKQEETRVRRAWKLAEQLRHDALPTKRRR
jgi:hypothetical protein